MSITITINIPEEELLIKLVAEGLTRKEFESVITAEFLPLIDASELCPGATAKVTVV